MANVMFTVFLSLGWVLPHGCLQKSQPILVHIRQNLVIRCVIYLDDLLIFWEAQDRLPSKGKESNDTVTRTGFHNKYKKINLRAHSADRVSGPNS